MEILQDPVFKTKYQKYKNRVKLWESRFTEKHGRKPNKNDIKEADIKIKESYKMYWKLKTRALEETLLDITFSDEMEDNLSINSLGDTATEEVKDVHKPLRDDNNHILESSGEKEYRNAETSDEKNATNTDERSIVENADKKHDDSRAVDRTDKKHADLQAIESTDKKHEDLQAIESTNKKQEDSELIESTDKKHGDSRAIESTDENNRNSQAIESTDKKHGDSQVTESTFNKDTENIDPQEQHGQSSANSCPTSEPEHKNIKGVWGDHLSKSNEQIPKKKKPLLIGRSSSFQLSQNKFTGSNFTKRNPRKSLSAIKIRTKSEKDNAKSETTNKAPQQTANAEMSNKDEPSAEKETKRIFGEAVKVTYAEPKAASQSISTIQQVMDGHTVNRNLNSGWLNRCAKQNNLEYPAFDSQRLSGTSDSGVESMESSSVYSPREIAAALEPQTPSQISDDDEDFVCNSDSEEERKHKRIRNFKKRFDDQDSHPSKRLCTESRANTLGTSNTDMIYSIKGTSNTLRGEERGNFNDTGVVAAKTNGISNNINTTNTISNISTANTVRNINTARTTSNINDISNINTETNLADNAAKRNDEPEVQQTVNADAHNEENTEESEPKGKSTTRKVRRRVKRISDDNSDPDFDVSEEKQKKGKRKATNTEKAAGSRKTKAAKSAGTRKTKTAKSAAPSEKNVDGKPTRKYTRRKKKTEDDEEDILEAGNADLEAAKEKQPPIYGIETLKAVPRFAVSKKRGQGGDLIEQFAKSVSSTAESSSSAVAVAKPKGKLTDKEKLEQKVAEGKVNENFVRINLKKKVFVRGKKHFNFSKYKKNQWKQRKKELGSSEGSLEVADFMEKTGVSSCFKCGEIGHYARRCPNRKPDDLIPLEEVDEGSQFPTLEEAQKMASENAFMAHVNRLDRLPEQPAHSTIKEESAKEETQESTKEETQESTKEETETKTEETEDLWEHIEDEEMLCGHKIPEDLVKRLLPPDIGKVQPLYELNEHQSCIDTPAEVFETLRKFGHDAFRPGQEKAVMRILSGQSTLVTLSTGSGKSLCYQLPAYLYCKYSNCITLVISPLVSLMDDQVTGVPAFLSAACLHTNQTQKVRDNVMQMVKQGKVNILLISPEAVVAGEKSTGFGALLRQLPPISFACIDEAHCISQWSHNFRPSYLMVCRVLKEKLGVNTVLALTATATKTTKESIVRHLGIQDGMEGVISDIPMPSNLLLSVSKDQNRDEALIQLLLGERFQGCYSVIVYCTRREECARIAGLLRVSLQDPKNPDKPNSRLSSIAEAYHAGLSAHRRKIVQTAFMGGQTRIVVATVAFGMGLNKPDIRAVIHYNMPGTFEGYVQEVGRAGRDGLVSHCHLFLNPKEDRDKWELRRHIYANGVDRHTIRRLLQKVFVPCSCAKLRERNANLRCPGHEVAIPVDETVIALDIPEETISTLLCYLELHPRRFITVLSSVYVRARVSSYSGPQSLKQAAQSSPPLAMAIALDLQNGVSHENSNVIEFPVVDVASAIGWDSGVVKSHLKNLEWKTVNGTSKRSAISVRYDKLGLRVKAPGDLTEVELDEALDALVSRAQSQETSALRQLETIGVTLHQFSVPSVKECLVLNDELTSRSEHLKTVIRSYFDGQLLLDIDLKKQNRDDIEAEIVSDVRNMIVSYRDNNFTGRAVARIFHGIQSPNYPAYCWNKCRFWRSHLSYNFSSLCQIATREILALR